MTLVRREPQITVSPPRPSRTLTKSTPGPLSVPVRTSADPLVSRSCRCPGRR